MRYCFVDLYPEVLRQYPAGIARAVAEAEPEAEFWFVYNEELGSIDEASFPPGSRFRYSGAPTYGNIAALLVRVAPDVLVFTAQRVPDSAFVSVARQFDIPTVMFQHGLYVPFLRRAPLFVFTRAAKMWRYIRFAGVIAKAHGHSRVRYMTELGRVFLLGKPYAKARIDHERLNVDRVLIHGEYWRSWHSDKYGYRPDQQVVVGYPDFERLHATRKRERTEALCYVAQTFVEDGRMQRSRYEAWLELLGNALGGRRLIVKLHPRSEEDLYAGIVAREGVTLSRDILPRAVAYIGHYSTLLVLTPFITRNLLLWELEGHDIPEVLQRVAAEVTADEDVLREFIRYAEHREPDEGQFEELHHYFRDNPDGAYNAAAREVTAMARSGAR